MKILVIGGGGPTGLHVVEGLRQRGYKVSVLNRGVHPVELLTAEGVRERGVSSSRARTSAGRR